MQKLAIAIASYIAPSLSNRSCRHQQQTTVPPSWLSVWQRSRYRALYARKKHSSSLSATNRWPAKPTRGRGKEAWLWLEARRTSYVPPTATCTCQQMVKHQLWSVHAQYCTTYTTSISCRRQDQLPQKRAAMMMGATCVAARALAHLAVTRDRQL